MVPLLLAACRMSDMQPDATIGSYDHTDAREIDPRQPERGHDHEARADVGDGVLLVLSCAAAPTASVHRIATDNDSRLAMDRSCTSAMRHAAALLNRKGRAATVFDETGELDAVIGADVDITERKQFEISLREADAKPSIIW